jgi:hypothetical protein
MVSNRIKIPVQCNKFYGGTDPRIQIIWSVKMIAVIACMISPGCRKIPDIAHETLVNTGHLEHLFDTIETEQGTRGVIWIYCEAPDYVLTDDDDEGFTCVDDVARALVFYTRAHRQLPDQASLEKITLLTNFILEMQVENGLFYNFVFPDRSVNTSHRNSLAIPDWWAWRAFWALSEVNLTTDPELSSLRNLSRNAIERLLPHVKDFCIQENTIVQFGGVEIPDCFVHHGADQAAVILIGLTNYYRSGATDEIMQEILRIGNLLIGAQKGNEDSFPYGAFLSWRNLWHAWGNSQAFALLCAGSLSGEDRFISAGLREVDGFYPHCLERGFLNEFQVTESNDALIESDTKRFPQIAYGIRPMVFAALEAFEITSDSTYAAIAGNIGSWLLGNNPAGIPMYDPETGRTFDGITAPGEINRNSGAESTIEALLTLQALESVPEAQQILTQSLQR